MTVADLFFNSESLSHTQHEQVCRLGMKGFIRSFNKLREVDSGDAIGKIRHSVSVSFTPQTRHDFTALAVSALYFCRWEI